jgi:DNA-binding winged helix-turn-helix (wHTH) protein
MSGDTNSPRVIRFAAFELDLEACELHKNSRRLKFSGQPLQVLAILLENPGKLVTREQFQQRLWTDTFVDVDHSLNTAVNKIREVLGDSAENPRFVETVPRRGYRFLAPLGTPAPAESLIDLISTQGSPAPSGNRLPATAVAIFLIALASFSIFLIFVHRSASGPAQHALTRLTFDDGLQTGPTWLLTAGSSPTAPIGAASSTSGFAS